MHSFSGNGRVTSQNWGPTPFLPYRVPVGSVVAVAVGVPVSRLTCDNGNITQSRPALVGVCYSSLISLLVFYLSLE